MVSGETLKDTDFGCEDFEVLWELHNFASGSWRESDIPRLNIFVRHLVQQSESDVETFLNNRTESEKLFLVTSPHCTEHMLETVNISASSKLRSAILSHPNVTQKVVECVFLQLEEHNYFASFKRLVRNPSTPPVVLHSMYLVEKVLHDEWLTTLAEMERQALSYYEHSGVYDDYYSIYDDYSVESKKLLRLILTHKNVSEETLQFAKTADN